MRLFVTIQPEAQSHSACRVDDRLAGVPDHVEFWALWIGRIE
jgi:hypothetical protein